MSNVLDILSWYGILKEAEGCNKFLVSHMSILAASVNQWKKFGLLQNMWSSQNIKNK